MLLQALALLFQIQPRAQVAFCVNANKLCTNAYKSRLRLIEQVVYNQSTGTMVFTDLVLTGPILRADDPASSPP